MSLRAFTHGVYRTLTNRIHIVFEGARAIYVPQLLHESVGSLQTARHAAGQVVCPLVLSEPLQCR